MLRSRVARPTVVLVALLALATACTGEEGPTVETAEVVSGEVVQTVAAVAALEPAARVTVTTPVGGEVARLLVEDGQQVAAGDALAELSSESVELQIAQAESAVRSADALAGAAGAAGFDLSPLLGAFRAQLEATLPPVLDALTEQARVIEDDDLRAAAIDRVVEARAAYAEARDGLLASERDAASQAQQATAAQRAAAAAQRDQAALALEAAEGRGEDLVIVAPIAGVIELGRADAGGADLGLGGLAGQLGGAAGGPGAIDGLLGGGAADGTSSGPVAEGVTLGPGQTVATIYDLSAFTARVDVDEIDIVEVERDQAVTVLVDAFPAAEVRGTVANVAVAPVTGPGGGASFPVTVRLTQVPPEVELRVGLTASAEIEVRRRDADTTVPTAALLRRGGQEVVFVLEDGVVREVPVTVAALGDESAAVEGDLSPGDRVVTTGIDAVEDGQRLEG
ncbi:MAG: biotin/lipoyl-binding protein [Nitriliruptor sp.]